MIGNQDRYVVLTFAKIILLTEWFFVILRKSQSYGWSDTFLISNTRFVFRNFILRNEIQLPIELHVS